MTSALTAYEAVMAVVAKGLESTGGYLARRVKQTALKSAWEAQDLTGALARIDAALRTQQTLLQDKLAVMQAEDTEKLRPLVAAWRKVADRYEPILDKAKALTVRVSCTDTTTLLGAVQGILKEAVAALNVLGVAPASAATSSPFHVLTTVHHSITDTEAAVKALLDKLGCPSNPRTPEELQEALDREAQRKTKAQQALKDATDISDPIERELAVKVATAEVDAATQQAVKLGADLVDAKSKADVVQLAAVQSSQRALADKCTQLQGACDRARTYVQRREAGWQLQAKAVGTRQRPSARPSPLDGTLGWKRPAKPRPRTCVKPWRWPRTSRSTGWGSRTASGVKPGMQLTARAGSWCKARCMTSPCGNWVRWLVGTT